jgi:hypothetical protein
MLVRAPTFERIGGVSRIRGEIIDDCALAREIRREGGRVWLGLTAKTRSLRSYGGFGDIADMIARTAFTQLRHSILVLVGTIIGMALVYVAPVAALLSGNLTGAMFGASAWFLMTVCYTPTVRFYGQSLQWALLLPATAVFYKGATVLSAIRYWSGRGGSWKGRAQVLKR